MSDEESQVSLGFGIPKPPKLSESSEGEAEKESHTVLVWRIFMGAFVVLSGLKNHLTATPNPALAGSVVYEVGRVLVTMVIVVIGAVVIWGGVRGRKRGKQEQKPEDV